MKKRLDRVIRKMILPVWPAIGSFTIEETEGRTIGGEDVRVYKVIYVLKEDFSPKFYGLIDDTKNIFNMLSPNEDERINVFCDLPSDKNI